MRRIKGGAPITKGYATPQAHNLLEGIYGYVLCAVGLSIVLVCSDDGGVTGFIHTYGRASMNNDLEPRRGWAKGSEPCGVRQFSKFLVTAARASAVPMTMIRPFQHDVMVGMDDAMVGNSRHG